MDFETWDPDLGTVPAGAGDPVVNRPSANWDPGSINPAAGSWDDVLKLGMARLIDAKTRPVRPENTMPVLADEGSMFPRLGASGGTVGIAGVPMWMLLAGAGVALYLVLR